LPECDVGVRIRFGGIARHAVDALRRIHPEIAGDAVREGEPEPTVAPT
jgi:hypothetical protein